MKSVVQTSSHKENKKSQCFFVWILSKIQGADNPTLYKVFQEIKIIGKIIQITVWAYYKSDTTSRERQH